MSSAVTPYKSGDSSFPCYIEASPHCNNLGRKVNKEGSTKPQTSVREINSNNIQPLELLQKQNTYL